MQIFKALKSIRNVDRNCICLLSITSVYLEEVSHRFHLILNLDIFTDLIQFNSLLKKRVSQTE